MHPKANFKLGAYRVVEPVELEVAVTQLFSPGFQVVLQAGNLWEGSKVGERER